MRTAVPFAICLILLAGCARQEINPPPPANATPAPNSDAVGPMVLSPLPGIWDDHPAPDNTLGLDKAETAQADKPDDPTANLNLAMSYYKAKAFADAARVFARTAQLIPDNPTPLLYLGYTQMAVGALDGAIQTFERLQTLKGVSPEIISEADYNIGVCQATLKNSKEAMAAYTKALEKNPRNGMASLALGAVAAEQGETGKAKTFFSDAANNLPVSRHKAQAYAALGKLAEGEKDIKTAIAQYKKALAIDRDNPWADEGLRRLSPGKRG